MTTQLTRAWLGLMALTLVAWWLGHSASGTWLGLTVFAMTALKGQWLVDRFMELRQAPVLFRALVSGWLIVVVGAMAALGL